MDDLLTKLKADGNFIDAYLVAKNILSRNISDTTAFKNYIDLALEIASYNIVFAERKQYVSEANTALAMFSEAANIDEAILALIKETRKRICTAIESILEQEQEYLDEMKRKAEDKNTDLLNKLVQIYQQIQNAKTQKQFDAALLQVTEVESAMDKSAFSKEQSITYEKLTQKYSELISRQMETINKNELLEYNKKAVVCFNEVLLAFKKEPSKYKDESTLKALMTTKFFAFDSSKLFNESLVFYNHVYSIVFQESSDAMKYRLTEWALNTIKLEK